MSESIQDNGLNSLCEEVFGGHLEGRKALLVGAIDSL